MRDKATKKEKFSFQIEGINPDHYHPLELHKCGVYVTILVNYNPQKIRQEIGFGKDLWYYQYNNTKRKILTFSEIGSHGDYDIPFFNDDFRISSDEKYIALERNYLGQEDYALVIKDLNTKEDLLVLKLKDILEQNPDVQPGSFGLGKWTDDGRYFRGDVFDGALSTAYYIIEAGTWKVNIYAAPPDILAGVERALNFNNLHLAYVDIPTFTGIREVSEQIIEQAKKEGKRKNLYVYNLKTKEKTKVASTDPEKRFNLKWLSDTELEYELPGGEKKIYKINEG